MSIRQRGYLLNQINLCTRCVCQWMTGLFKAKDGQLTKAPLLGPRGCCVRVGV
eukprot:COSAG05_NODE_19584_length_290_cov_1.062827_1_plen_52_part_01